MEPESRGLEGEWALILGASSGFGAATSLELARVGMNIFGVHLDLRATLPNAQKVIHQIREMGQEAVFFNSNAADPEKRRRVIDQVKEKLHAERSGKVIRVFLHSLAFGTLKPYVGPSPQDALNQSQMEMTLDVMANSLVYWVQDLYFNKLLGRGSRIYAMTSAGSQRIIPHYGAVSAAKAALESHIRQLAYELAPMGISANCIRAGVTDTPALRKIPGHERLLEGALARHPSGRTTTPTDVAQVIALLSSPKAQWMTGTIIGVDGGEDIVA